MKSWFVFILIFFNGQHLVDIDEQALLIVWNVGQGQWVTEIHENSCEHYDFGGEAEPLKKVLFQVQKLCARKLNHLHLSHWDQDHWGALPKMRSRLPQLCHNTWPEHLLNKKIKPWLSEIEACPITENPLYRPDSKWTELSQTTSNDLSQVYLTTSGFLIPGDSTIKMEKIWAQRLAIRQLRVLILGHHGSRTSTSDLLLEAIPSLKMAISTARKKRFGHPHLEVIRRLAFRKIPLLRTEDWGTLGFGI